MKRSPGPGVAISPIVFSYVLEPPIVSSRICGKWSVSLSLRQAFRSTPPSIHDAEVEQWTESVTTTGLPVRS